MGTHTAASPVNEVERLAALRDLRIVDTQPEAHFDAVCRTAALLFSVPIALVSFIESDRQWFKAKCGIAVDGTSRDAAFCSYAILSDDVLVVEDATTDPRFARNPLVTGEPGIRFYVGAPLVLNSDIRLGTLCIIDTKPRSFSNAQKAQLQDLARIVVAHIELHRERSAIEAALEAHRASEERVAYMARHDTLTGLPNRIVFHEKLKERMAEVQRGQGRTALLRLDLDRFRSVNDTLGHPAGDDLLCQIAVRLRESVREGDVVVRIGGDEFAIIVSHLDHVHQASKLAQRVIDAVDQPLDLGGHFVTVGVSIGIALAPADGDASETLFKNADLALHRAKATARSSYSFYEFGMDATVEARMQLELEMREAVMCGAFALHYQPVLNLAEHRIVGFEALMRWPHPTRGMIPPDIFIPLTEESGMIVPLGSWALQTACREAASWPNELRVAVNVSAIQFQQPGLEESVLSALAASGLAPHRLVLEITESVLVQDAKIVLACLHRLKEVGVRIALDDFGTGYSSLSYLRQFPFDTIKIDRSFIREISDPGAAAIVRAVVGIATQLGAAVTAEGVETTDQLERVGQEGCTDVQGYLVSRPLSAEMAMAFIESSSLVEHAYQRLCEAEQVTRSIGDQTSARSGPAFGDREAVLLETQRTNEVESSVRSLQVFMDGAITDRRVASEREFKNAVKVHQTQRRAEMIKNFI